MTDDPQFLPVSSPAWRVRLAGTDDDRPLAIEADPVHAWLVKVSPFPPNCITFEPVATESAHGDPQLNVEERSETWTAHRIIDDLSIAAIAEVAHGLLADAILTALFHAKHEGVQFEIDGAPGDFSDIDADDLVAALSSGSISWIGDESDQWCVTNLEALALCYYKAIDGDIESILTPKSARLIVAGSNRISVSDDARRLTYEEGIR